MNISTTAGEDEPLGWRELVDSGAIDKANPQARETIARFLLDLIQQGKTDPAILKAEVIKRFGSRPS
jgi:hypothetical protein